MKHTLAAIVWRWSAFGAFTCASALLLFVAVGHKRGLGFYLYGRYASYLRARLRVLHVFRPVEPVIAAQVLGVFVTITLIAIGRMPYGYVVLVAIAGGPSLVIERRIRARVAKIDAGAGVFALSLANAMKATPSLGQAIHHVAHLVDGPIAEELQLALKEMRLGSSFDQAMGQALRRCGSSKLATVFISLLIGRQLGGNMIVTLDTTATTLRELARLEGVLKQRTAEGRMQLWAMIFAPFVLCYGAYKVDPRYFEPLLTNGLLGHVCIGGAAIGYAAAVIAARRIITVDL